MNRSLRLVALLIGLVSLVSLNALAQALAAGSCKRGAQGQCVGGSAAAATLGYERQITGALSAGPRDDGQQSRVDRADRRRLPGAAGCDHGLGSAPAAAGRRRWC